MNLEQIKIARRSFLGLAVGVAIGTTAEFKSRGSFPLVTDMTTSEIPDMLLKILYKAKGY